MEWKLSLLVLIYFYTSVRAQVGGDPCSDYTLHDCDREAICRSERTGFFECTCPAGFIDDSPDPIRFPGRRCRKEENECHLGTARCDPNAECIDLPTGYTCRCRNGWSDQSTNRASEPGRVCKRGNTCRDLSCAREAECRETGSGPICQCRVGFVDVSSQRNLPQGHACAQLVDECRRRTHDCSPNARCIDTAAAFTCSCHDGYRDESPDPRRRPGRLCVQEFVPEPPECDVRDPLSCDVNKFEVCLFVDGTYKCQCPNGITRLSDGRCKVLNECEDQRLNDCSSKAQCLDTAESYTCQCRPGYVDVSSDSKRPGRRCRLVVDECRDPSRFQVNCHHNAVCVDVESGYECRCLPGYADVSAEYNQLPGRQCVEAINECANNDKNDCSVNAICDDAKIGYTCRCRDGFVDASPNITVHPGRVCNKPKDPRQTGPPGTQPPENSFRLESCIPNVPNSCRGNFEICSDASTRGQYVCECSQGYTRFEGKCVAFTACSSQTDCDPQAVCTNAFNAYECHCRPGFLDMSPDPIRRPGRVCKELINECAHSSLNDCDPVAMCVDARDGYACMCPAQYADVSSSVGLKPGRKCINASNECDHRSLNTCDINADCIDTINGYECVCIPGFYDVSSSANLPLGRVCSVQTVCPKQATDLMFLVDGSGSIGTFTFKNEVLRFVREFVELFDIGPSNTRVGLIQYSEQIRHEFDFGSFQDKIGVLQGISNIKYMTGLTNTGLAIEHMVQEGFAGRRGARVDQSTVAKVAIVITDGRSQDAVAEPARKAREMGINIFVIGVTDHVKDTELEEIAGSKDRYFHVNDFTDLNTRLRSLVQKAVCPVGDRPIPSQHCDPLSQTGCDRRYNEICVERSRQFKCECPDGFQRHPITSNCGGEQCNPNVPSLCKWPSVCKQTPLGTYLCSCPLPYQWHTITGQCADPDDYTLRVCRPHDNSGCGQNEHCERQFDGRYACVCNVGYSFHSFARKCVPPDWCDTSDPNACDKNKNEQCQRSSMGYHKCTCPSQYYRHQVTGVCLLDECLIGRHDCDRNAKCIDTDAGYLCKCNEGFLDQSPDQVLKPGRVCASTSVDECFSGTHNCSHNARCTDLKDGFLCECNPGYVDVSPNRRQFSGLVCQPIVNECERDHLNDCHPNAICTDALLGYTCHCDAGYEDVDPLRNPGRQCRRKFVPCEPGNNDCDRNARCTPQGATGYTCACPANYRDRSPDPSKPGRVCIAVTPECENPSLNDCDTPDKAICTDTLDGYFCRCKPNYLDISPDPARSPGRRCLKLVNECLRGEHDCDQRGAICDDTPEDYACRCKTNYLDVSPDPINRPGRHCKEIVPECLTGQNECDPKAECIDTDDSYICKCKQGFADLSLDPLTRPGRRCVEIRNECLDARLNDCSPNAQCFDTPESYRCQCTDAFNDESPDPGRPGRICTPKLVDECRLQQHNCHVNALCIDRANGYTCKCNDGYLDQSSDRITQPGRLCVPKPTPKPPECFLERSDSCRTDLKEVCRLINGEPKCGCPQHYQRHSRTRACTVINECLFPHLNDCAASADCIDQQDGYTCRCKQHFIDADPSNPGRFCEPVVPECKFDHLNDCHQYAGCIELDKGYTCECLPGYLDLGDSNRPGRICKEIVNECNDPALNTCDQNAECIDQREGYECRCREGYYDISPTPTNAGRACKRIVNECRNPSLNDCHQSATCTDTLESYRCDCPPQSRDISPNPAFPGRVCLVFDNECNSGKHDCDRNALCRDTEDSFTCECKPGYTDRSPTPNRPGRNCRKLVDECRDGTHTCAPQAECRDLEEGYYCECKDGYVDLSPDLQHLPGRICGPPEVCPVGHQCSSAAVCEPLGGNDYNCICVQGYVDKSPPGAKRGTVCVRANDCLSRRNNDCSENAMCINHDQLGKYECLCKDGYVDMKPDWPGRQCIDQSQNSTSVRRKPIITSTTTTTTETSVRRVKPVKQTGNLNMQPLATTTDRTGSTETTTKYRPFVIPLNIPWSLDGTVDECRDPRTNNCSRNAICYNLPNGYRCECIQGYQDRSPNPALTGRICEPILTTPPPVHPCQDPNRNDCHYLGKCRSIPGSTDQYTCECPERYVDRSPDPINRPGRICVPDTEVCFDPNKNDCDEQGAVCIPVQDNRQYTCRCRDGFVDQSHDPNRPGRLCKRRVNECLDARLNDCADNAVCEDLADGYQCRCPPTTLDESPDQGRPGRYCTPLVNECQTRLHNCSLNADCHDLARGYECHCRQGYFDNNPSVPGRECAFIFNECTAPNLNDCDKFHADCIDEQGGYSCRCRPPYRDESPDPRKPGRVCRYNECNDPGLNDCDGNAVCQDTDNSYVCHCRQGYVDDSPDPKLLGRRCILAPSSPSNIVSTSTAPPNSIQCGNDYCYLNLGEVCVPNPFRCQCRYGYARRNAGEECIEAIRFVLPLIVAKNGGQTLKWSSDYGNTQSGPYIDITQTFEQAMGDQLRRTLIADKYIGTDVLYINPPQYYNSSWSDGLMFNYSIALTVDHGLPSICHLYQLVLDSLTDSQLQIGRSPLFISPEQADLCPKPKPTCGSEVCIEALGEICIRNTVCGCPLNQKRPGPGTKCTNVESFQLMLWVVRDGQNYITYHPDYSNPQTTLHQQYVQRFVDGLKTTYGASGILHPWYVNSEVSYIQDPRKMNGTWNRGLLYNFTVNFIPGKVANEQDVWNELIRICSGNNYQIGTSGLYINPYQISPWSSCFNNKCYVNGSCFERGPNSYTCRCPEMYIDLDPFTPGRRCQSRMNVNECERPDLTECHENARCLDLEFEYECRCLAGFKDTSPEGSRPGSLCTPDYCSDVHYCPTNTTCVNLETEAQCKCDPTFIDIRRSTKRVSLGLEGVLCLALRDVDECSLGLTDCSGVAICKDLINGYECKCPTGYIDGSPENPGRVCGARLCGLCNGNGDCVHNEQTQNVTCACYDGFSGEFCEVAAANISLYLLIILAIIFLLLTLCCLCYFCMKCRCVQGTGLWYREPLFTYRKSGPWSTLEHSTSSESGEGMSAFGKSSDYYPQMIPRAKLRSDAAQMSEYLEQDLRIPRPHIAEGAYDSESMSSGYTVREEIERRVITDTKRIIHNAEAEVHASSSSAQHAVTAASSSAAAAGASSSVYADSRKPNHQSNARRQQNSISSSLSPRDFSTSSHNTERERGQSEAAFSVGGITQTDGSSHWDDNTSYNQDRAMSEYMEHDSDETVSQGSQEAAISEREVVSGYDRKVLAKGGSSYETAGGAASRQSYVSKGTQSRENF